MKGVGVGLAILALVGCQGGPKKLPPPPQVEEFVEPPDEARFNQPPEQGYRKPKPKQEFRPGPNSGMPGVGTPGGGMMGPQR